jgi:hypothetical protein
MANMAVNRVHEIGPGIVVVKEPKNPHTSKSFNHIREGPNPKTTFLFGFSNSLPIDPMLGGRRVGGP